MGRGPGPQLEQPPTGSARRRGSGRKIAPLIGATPGEVVGRRLHLGQPVQAARRRAALRQAPRKADPRRAPATSRPTSTWPQGLAGLPRRRAAAGVAPTTLEAAIDDDIAVVMLTHVHYKTGRRARHGRGHRARPTPPARWSLWDLSHSAGAMRVDLDGCERRPRGRLRLQVPERRPGRAGVPVRRRARSRTRSLSR